MDNKLLEDTLEVSRINVDPFVTPMNPPTFLPGGFIY